MVSPVPKRIKVVRSVIAVVKAETVRLDSISLGNFVKGCGKKSLEETGEIEKRALTGTSISVILDRKSEVGSISSTSAC